MSSSSLPKPYTISTQDLLLSPNLRRSSNMNTFGMQKRYGNYFYESSGDGAIEFRPHTDAEEPGGGIISPPLWKTSPSTSPPTEAEETTPLQSSSYTHHHYRLLSPTSRAQAIARGRQELMEMVKNMPESSYELSLKDLVDHSKVGFGKSTACVDPLDTEEAFDDSGFTIQTEKKKKMWRSGSFNTTHGTILLKMVLPISLGRQKRKKKSLTTGTCAKVSPRPVEGEKDKDWWKKRPSVASVDTENNGSTSGGSSNSSSSSRNKGDTFAGCWSVFYTKKNKSTVQKGNKF